MQYELIGENDITNLFDTVLHNRNVIGEEAKKLILNPTAESLIFPFKLKNMEEAIVLLLTHYEKGSKIAVVVDSDMDGYTSATVMMSFLQSSLQMKDVHFIIHKGKEHGINDYIIEQAVNIYGANLIITPDASSNDWVAHKKLKDMGVDVLVLDHHEIEINSNAIAEGLCSPEGESRNAVVVNPLLSPDYHNKQISGVGVTYKFIQAFCEYCSLPPYAEEYLDLVAMGNVADMMDLRSPETRYLVYEGLKKSNLKNPLLKAMVKSYSGANTYMTPERVSWDIAPKINGMIRVGKLEEKTRMMEAFLGIEYEMKRTWRGKEYVESLPDCVAREAKNAHSRGKNLKSKLADSALMRAEELDILDKKIVIIPMESLPSGMGGIVAQEVSSRLKKPVSIVSDYGDNYAGSVRGYDPVHTDTKSLFENSGLVNFARGHGQAHGVSFPKEHHLTLIERISEDLVNSDNKLPVDFILPSRMLSTNLVKRVDTYSEYFGHGVHKPKFVFTDIELTSGIMTFNANSIIVDYNGVQVVSYKKDEELQELIESDNKVTVDIIGALGVGQWRGKAKFQLQIDTVVIKNTTPHKKDTVKKGFGYIAF